MIAETYFDKLADEAAVNASENEEVRKAVNEQGPGKPSFVKVRLERCCISVEISLQKEVAAQAMSSAVSAAKKIFKS